ncbi:hypothetical protein ACFQPA_06850 [Halomarina halobia]|uniref:MarR family transcriptional regulator n=1 Tax=Halomarina halobia TaxID=3033386 RepID=A0ABD6A6A8_9EURY|nr:hypothetical protein [Halomarina sp. PSR21]
MDRSLPPRLSSRQQFILAVLATEDNMSRIVLSRLVAKEFDAVEPSPSYPGEQILTANHRSTHSRSLERLYDRGLITNFIFITPTDDGRAVGQELRRRHADGRYSLQFNTEPWHNEALVV